MKTQIKTKTWDSVRKTARRILPVTLLALLGMVAIPQGEASAATAAWGPERETFTWESPARKRTINSITNNPQIGDERNFVRVRKLNSNDKFGDNVRAVAGETYEVYVYFHNNANTSMNESGKGIANNVRLSMEFPEVIYDGQAAMIKGTISSTNTDPGSVWDTAYIHAPDNQTVYLRYVPNSAKIHSFGTIDGETLSDSALYSKEGAKLGYYANNWGVLPGCNEYSGYVTFQVKVDQPGFYMEKTASLKGENNWQQYITVAPGDTLDFKIRYHNTGTTLQTKVTAFDNLPNGMELIGGSTFLETPTTKGFEKDSLFSGGLVIGDYTADQEAIITYQVKIADDETIFPCGDTVIYNNSAVATGNGTIHDKVQVTVHRGCEPDTPSELPKTGPGEIVLGLVVVTALGVTGTYYVMSRKQLKHLQSGVSGKDSDTE